MNARPDMAIGLSFFIGSTQKPTTISIITMLNEKEYIYQEVWLEGDLSLTDQNRV